jgi:hypothetical protein
VQAQPELIVLIPLVALGALSLFSLPPISLPFFPQPAIPLSLLLPLLIPLHLQPLLIPVLVVHGTMSGNFDPPGAKGAGDRDGKHKRGDNYLLFHMISCPER